jgi:hypothetical protein
MTARGRQFFIHSIILLEERYGRDASRLGLFPSASFPRLPAGKAQKCKKYLNLLVGAPRFELGTPSPPDWCANRAALRSETD